MSRVAIPLPATILLYRLFDVTPEVQQVFPKFKDVPRNQLESNTAYKSHTLNVVKTVQKAIDSFNDIPALSEKLQKLGKRHTSYGISGSEPFDVSVNNAIFVHASMQLIFCASM